jgi:hypothetical protein
MINLFRKHPKENGYSGYLSHFAFAFAVSLRLSIVSTYFLIHAIFPFIPVPKSLNLEETIDFMVDKNQEIL